MVHLVQVLNGVQLGIMLFLMASGLTLVFGILNVINLAHGTLYMMGAFLAVTLQRETGSLVLALLVVLPAMALLGALIEVLVFRALYTRDKIDQVLCTFGLILFFNELALIVWGPAPIRSQVPSFLAGSVELAQGLTYPVFRLAIIGVGLLTAALLWALVARTRVGMLIRAGASDREMAGALGVNISLLYTAVFALGAALAGLAGLMVSPLFSVQVGMGDSVIILTLVVIVIGGIGSMRGAFVAALVIGLIDTFARLYLPAAFGQVCIFVLMAVILYWRPRGLFPAHG